MFHDWMWGGGMWFGWIFWIVILGLIIFLILNQNKRRENYPSPNHETSLDILKKRYAKGEITKEQFDQMKKDLE